ncbi:MAG: FG-GAP-like repeat-containing protein [Bacteroidota bacterium]
MALLLVQHALASGAPSSTEGSGATATVVNVTPQAGSVSAARTTSVLANFSSALDPATVTAANVKLFGSMSGAMTGTITTPAASQIFIQPTTPFVRGETVTVTLGSGMQTAGGQAITPYQWSFTVAAEGSTGTFGKEQRIQSGASGAANMTTGDVDGDGDIDLVGSPPGGGLAWYANDGRAGFTLHPLSSSGAEDLKVVDLNGDGHLDVLTASGDAATWYRNNGAVTPSFTPVTVATAGGMTSVSVADMDGDGDLDVISGALNAVTKVGWSENQGGVFGARQAIANDGTGDGVLRVEAADMDGDGDADVVASWLVRDEVVLYENRGLAGFTPHVVSNDPRVFVLEIADMDQDGALDIVVVNENSTLTGYRNQGGHVFSSVFTFANAPVQDIQPVDIDADGDLDLVAAQGSIGGFSLAVYTNTPGTVLTRTEVGDGASGSSNGVAAADLDGDGDLDIAASFGFGFISWFEHGASPFTVQSTVPAQAALGVARSTPITVTFCENVDQGTVNETTFTVRGSHRGAYAGTFSFPAPNQLQFDPAQDFLPGEVVTVVASPNIRSSDGIALGDYQWSFLAASGAASGAFSTGQAVTSAADGAQSVYAADVDGDGDLDVLSASDVDDTIAWYENDGSQGFTKHAITTTAPRALSVYAADIDGDGDMDVLSPSGASNTIAWYENDGSQNFTERVVTSSENLVTSVYAADVDGDGDLDVLSASFGNDTIAWYENDGSQNFTKHAITTTADGATSVYAADVDGDGDLDVLSASFNDDTIAWYENDGNYGFTKRVVTTTAASAQSVYAADVDGDGDLDVLSASSGNDTIAWYENDGSQGFTKRVITTMAVDATSVYAADVDGDGELDVLSASFGDDTIAWFEHASFVSTTVSPTANALGAARSANITATFSDNVDQGTVSTSTFTVRGSQRGEYAGSFTYPTANQLQFDPAQDFLPGEVITVTANSGLKNNSGVSLKPFTWMFTAAPNSGTGTFASAQSFPASTSSSQQHIHATDVDGDGDLDAVAASFSDDKVEWYENDGSGSFTAHLISTAADGATSVHAADFDGDGDMDLVSTSQGDAEVAWYENDGNQTFSRTVIAVGFSGFASDAAGVFPADVDGDGDMDIVSAGRGGFIAWHENDGAADPTFTPIQISATMNGAKNVHVADVDGDGDLDVVVHARNTNTVAWFENNGDVDPSFTQQTLTTTLDQATSVHAGDVDGDGDLDIVAGRAFGGVTWFENDGAAEPSFTAQTVADPTGGTFAVYTTDVDGDGALDVLSASFQGASAWVHRNDGAADPSFATGLIDATSFAEQIYAADMDGDGDLDVLMPNGFALSWYEQQNTFAISAVSPTANALDATRDANITTTFSDNVNQGTVSTSTFTVRGSQRGEYAGSFTYPAANQLQFDPSQDFLPGEMITVTASNAIQSTGGPTLTPRSWSFTAAPDVGPSTFGAQQVISTQADIPFSIYPADLDGDGDVDVLSASFNDDKIAWYANDGSGGFGAQQVISTQADGAQSVYAADVDGDGDMDVLATSLTDRKLVWYANDGSGNFGSEQVISTQADNVFSIYVADVEGDGDPDVLAAVLNGDKIVWYANDGNGSFGAEQVISTQADGARFVYAADVDGDGDIDVLSASNVDDKIAWYANDGSGGFGPQQVISTQADAAQSVYTADVDGDGDLDVLSASAGDDKIAWYENDGSGSFGAQQVISMQADGATSAYPTDVDGDGDVDVLSASFNDDKIAWYANDGSGGFGAQQVISTQADGAQSVYAADVDGDGDMDVLSASRGDDKIAWYEQVTPSFSVTSTTPAANAIGVARDANVTATFDAGVNQGTVSTSTFTVRGSQRGEYAGSFTYPTANQLQFDPVQDFLSGEVITVTASSGIQSTSGATLTPRAWSFRAAPERGAGAHTERIISTTADAAAAVRAVDVDGDGDLDVLAAATFDNAVLWYENDGSQGFTPRVITSSASGVSAIYAADVDGDGDMDVVSGAFSGSQVTWYENDGSQGFTTHVVAIRSGVFGVFAADVDSDGDIDLLSASLGDDSIVWYENDGSQGFTAHVITDTALGARSVYALDVDGDGDVDVLSASRTDNTIAWYENDGSQRFTKRTVTTAADAAFAVYAADVDGDGDVDVLSASSDDHKVAWHENDGSQGFTERVLPTTAFNARSVYAADADGDGDMDVLAAAGNTIAWYENDGSQGFTERILTTQAFNAASVHAADVDGDGDLDVLSASGNDDTIAWYEQALPTATISGDAGWRMLSAPAATFTPNDLADDTAIQGITGGANPADAPNLYTRPTTEAWTAPASVTTAFTPGLGFILYFYNNTSAGSAALPLTLDAPGLPPTADVTTNVAGGGFTLLGNPYAQAIALDQLAGNGTGGTGTGLVSPIQVWDDGTGTPGGGDLASTTGSFQTFNLGENQIIAPWQGFMLQSADATEATIPLAARSGSTPTIEILSRPLDDSLAVPEDEPAFRRIAFELAGPEGSGALDASAQLYFHAEASTGRDGYDGRKLVPLLGQYATLAFAAPDRGEELLVQDARSLYPVEVERYELAVSIAGLSGAFTLRWPQWEAIPDGWRVELRDRVTGDVVDLRESAQYVFESEATTASASKLGAGPRMRAQTASEAARRFELVVVSGAVLTGVGDVFEVPDRVTLLPSYPNPFNPSTTLGFALPVAGRAEVSVYNALGQRVAVVADGVYGAGRHEVVWEAMGLPSGVYVVRLQVGKQVQTRTVTLLK